MTQPLKKDPYGNYKVYDRHGTLIFRCAEKKINWYLERDLAHFIEDEAIQLDFETKGPGHDGDVFYLSDKTNCCVVCGTKDSLTVHHVVPKCYKKWFPENLKRYSSHDCLVMCINCHNTYEDHAFELKKEIGEEFGVPVSGIPAELEQDKWKAKRAAHALLTVADKLPDSRKEELLSLIKDYTGEDNFTSERLEEIQSWNCKKSDYKYHGESVVENLESLQNFVVRWRKHFVSIMNPKFLPKGWEVDRPIERNVWS